MALEISLLTIAFIVIIFSYTQNYALQQNNKIYHLNQSLLLQSNSTLEKLDTSLDFPLAHIADRYQDPLLKSDSKGSRRHVRNGFLQNLCHPCQ